MGIPLEDLATQIAAGQRPALARALSMAERDTPSATRLLSLLSGRLGNAHVLGVTGPPGAGKSTLVGVVVRKLIELGQRVAVLAVDPSSPVTGGALLGDRFRIGETVADDRSFVRSTATRGSLGGLTRAAAQMIKLMDAAGFDIVVVETVGTGQSDIDVAGLADSTLVVFPPGLGDELQAIKAGILELADLLVVTKSDTDAAKLACKALQTVAPLWRRAPPIHLVSAVTGEGIDELAATLIARVKDFPPSGRSTDSRKLQRQPALPDVFHKLLSQLSDRLPPELASGVSYQIVTTGGNDQTHGLAVRCTATSAISPFQLGAVAGALSILAAEEGLICRVEDQDRDANSMQLVLDRIA